MTGLNCLHFLDNHFGPMKAMCDRAANVRALDL